MTKVYNIEENINFFDELYKSLDIDDNENDIDLCLITSEPLKNNFIQLQCNHKFNYIPLYNDIKNHKKKFNLLEGPDSQLKINEIRCPYCRNKQTGLLPYYEELGLPQTHGVNYFDINRKPNMDSYKLCQYLTPNINYNENAPNAVEYNFTNSGNCKYFKCCNSSHFQISKFIENYTEEDLLVCYSHKNKIIKNKQKEEKEENKKIKMELKQKEKEEKEENKKIKMELKQKEKDDKKKEKDDKKKKSVSSVENIILSQTINIDISENPIHIECIEILKSGPNKGKQCGCKIYNTYYCKRHIKKTDIQSNLINLEIKT